MDARAVISDSAAAEKLEGPQPVKNGFAVHHVDALRKAASPVARTVPSAVRARSAAVESRAKEPSGRLRCSLFSPISPPDGPMVAHNSSITLTNSSATRSSLVVGLGERCAAARQERALAHTLIALDFGSSPDNRASIDLSPAAEVESMEFKSPVTVERRSGAVDAGAG
jgi:hypothetical protein